MKTVIQFLMGLGILCGSSTCCFSQVTYTETNLNSPYPQTNPLAVNNQGRIVGIGCEVNRCTALLWMQPGTTPQPIASVDSVAAISNRGQIVGTAYDPAVGIVPYLYDSNTGVFRVIGAAEGDARGINERGTVVGNSIQHTAFTYDTVRESPHSCGLEAVCPHPGGSAFAINNHGDLAGSVIGNGGVDLPAIYDADKSRWIMISVPGAIWGMLSSINDKGYAVGYWLDASDGIHPLLVRKDGSIMDLTAPPQHGLIGLQFIAVNNEGLAVGQDFRAHNIHPTNPYIFAYDIHTDTWIDLNSVLANPGGIPLGSVSGISSDGKIVAASPLESGNPGLRDGFLLTPVVHEKEKAADFTLR